MIPTLAVLVTLIILGVPVAVALGVTAIAFLATGIVPFNIVSFQMFSGLSNFVFLAMPMFMIAGEIMNRAGIAEDLIELVNAIVGWIRGGLGMANIGASMVFAEISGSAVADVASLGTILIPQMEKKGYPRPFAAAITSASASIAIIIPPSIPLIIYGALAEESVIKLFIAGLVPGVILGAFLMGFTYVFALRNGWPADSRFQFLRLLRAFRRAIWALALPVIILGGILGGVFTPTEAAAVAVAAALLIGLFITRRITLLDMPSIILVAAKRTSIVLLMVSTSAVLGWYLTNEGIPQEIAAQVMQISDNRYVLMFLINIMLIFLGMFLHGVAGPDPRRPPRAAAGDGARLRSHPLRDRDGPQLLHRPADPARRVGALRRLRGERQPPRRDHGLQQVVHPLHLPRPAARHLRARALPVASVHPGGLAIARPRGTP